MPKDACHDAAKTVGLFVPSPRILRAAQGSTSGDGTELQGFEAVKACLTLCLQPCHFRAKGFKVRAPCS